jgi:hypothetical protein
LIRAGRRPAAGAAPHRPAVIHFGFTCLYLERRDGAPPGPGILPAVDEVGRARCRAIRAEFDEAVVAPVQRHVDRRLAELGVGPLPRPVLDAIQAAARRVLSEPQFRIRTARFAEEFARYDTESEITRRVVEACDRNAVS